MLVEHCLGAAQRPFANSAGAVGHKPPLQSLRDDLAQLLYLTLKLFDAKLQLLEAFQRCHYTGPNAAKEAGDDSRPIR